MITSPKGVQENRKAPLGPYRQAPPEYGSHALLVSARLSS